MIKGTDGRTTITMNWGNFMRAAAIKKGDIFAFIFTVRCNKLRLTVNRLSHIDGRFAKNLIHLNKLVLPSYVFLKSPVYICVT